MLAELPPRGTHCTGREEEEEEKEEESLFKADAVREIWDQLVLSFYLDAPCTLCT